MVSDLSIFRCLLLPLSAFGPRAGAGRIALPPLLRPRRPAAAVAVAAAVPGQLGPLLAVRVGRGAKHSRLDVLLDGSCDDAVFKFHRVGSIQTEVYDL